MKEKDIVDFDKMEKDDDDYLDENGEPVGCHICYTHKKAYEKLTENAMHEIPVPHCPKCGRMLEERYDWTDDNCCAIVSESNHVVENGEIGYYPIFECHACNGVYDINMLFALMSVQVSWNANHDIYYTGGKDYINDKVHHELVDMVYDKCMPMIEQFVRRKLNPEDYVDKSLTIDFNLKRWIKYEVESAVAEWLYKHGYKK